MIDLLLVSASRKIQARCFQEATPTYLQRGTETKSTLKRAKPEEDYPGISEERGGASSEPSTFNNGWRTGNIREVREK